MMLKMTKGVPAVRASAVAHDHDMTFELFHIHDDDNAVISSSARRVSCVGSDQALCFPSFTHAPFIEVCPLVSHWFDMQPNVMSVMTKTLCFCPLTIWLIALKRLLLCALDPSFGTDI
jgi:hypothetical protein